MTDPIDQWAGPAGLFASAAALVAAIWKGRRNGDHGGLRTKLETTDKEVAVLKNEMKNIDRRLESIEENQHDGLAKLDRVIERLMSRP